MEALTIKNLKKTYEGNHEALKGIDLNVEEGDFFALLGPNGAGKTTTIRIISSLVNKTSVQVKILCIYIDQLSLMYVSLHVCMYIYLCMCTYV